MKYLAVVFFAIPFLLHSLDGDFTRALLFPVWWILSLAPAFFLSHFKIPWSISRVLGIYLIGLPLFLLYNFLELPFNSVIYWMIILAAMGFAWRTRAKLLLKKDEVLKGEFLFLAVFSTYLLINSFHPALYWGEKPMDISLLGYFLRFDFGPIQDPWASGTSLQYYALGYFSWALPARASFMSLEQSYVYTMAAVPALMSLASLAFFKAFRSKFQYFLAALVPFLGTLGVINSFMNANIHEPMKGFWAATRVFTHNHFAEFPLWSFLFSDLHPHVMSYPIMTAGFGLIVASAFIAPTRSMIFSVSICLVLLPWLNAWDFLLLAPIAAIILLSRGFKILNKEVIAYAALISFNALLAFSFLSSNSRNSIFEWSESSGLYGLSLHFGLALVAAIFVAFKNKNKKLWIIIGYCLAGILFFDHFVFMDRVNTVFKFFTSIGIFLSLFVLVLPTLHRSASVLVALLFVANLSLVAMILKPEAFPVKRPSLKGLSFLKYSLPSDAGIIEYFDSIPGLPLVLEYPGNSFDYQASRISSYTGLPILLGWDHHVVLRGKTWKEIMARKQWIKSMYESTDTVMVHNQLISRGVEFVVLGPTEKIHYKGAGLDKFDTYPQHFKLVKSHFSSSLYQVLSQ